MKISKVNIFAGILIYLITINFLFLFGIDSYFIRTVVFFVFMITIPGLLVMLILKDRKIFSWEYFVYIIGLSIAFLIFSGLFVNWLLPFFGIEEPLSFIPLFVSFEFLSLFLFIVAEKITKKEYFELEIPKPDKINWLFFLIPPIFPILSVLGAINLNNEGANTLTMIMLAAIAIYIFAAVAFRKKLIDGVFPLSILAISLSLLLMTSLRGWYTTGHDNQLEYFVFQLTKLNYTWDIAEYRDPYNASLSITILPTIFYSLLKINDIYIFKLLFQIIFSFTGVSLYLLFKKFSSRSVALLSVFAFVSFPTFINDMPMLNRQEIAMFFFSLVLLQLFRRSSRSKVNKVLFYTFGFSMVVSHYSTSYIAILLFVFVYFMYLVLRKNTLRIFSVLKPRNIRPRLKLHLIVGLMAFTFVWNVQLTATTESLSRIISETYKNIGKTFSQDLKSGGVLYNLFSWESLDKEQLFKNYINIRIKEIEGRSDKDQFYEKQVYETYDTPLLENYKIPQTPFGLWLVKHGISPFLVNFYLRQASAKIIQVIIIFGFFAILMRKSRFIKNVDREYLILAFASLFLIMLFILLPVLSVEYGTQRLFQQTLMVLSLVLLVGFLKILGRYISTFVVLVFFLSLSGFIPQITGDFYPQLHLNNSGIYYYSYLTHKHEVSSMKWLVLNRDERFDIYTNAPSHSKLAAISGLFSYKDILPAFLRKDAYVYLDYVNTKKEEGIVSYKGDLLVYKYPTEFLNQEKDLIYANGGSKIYK